MKFTINQIPHSLINIMKEELTTILVKSGVITTITLNRPEVHNAMDKKMIAELTMVFNSFKNNTESRAVILKGNGNSFCAGADLNYMKSIAGFGFEENVVDGKRLAGLFKSIYECPIPTIAIAHGSVFGGANGLLAACDIVFAEENTIFAFSEVKLGIAPATIAPFVIRRIGEFGAKELMLTGRRFSADEAEKWNLANHIYNKLTDENPEAGILKQFISSAPEAVKETKKLIVNILDKNINDGIDTTSKLIANLRASEEGQEGMSAFLEKRKANWNSE